MKPTHLVIIVVIMIQIQIQIQIQLTCYMKPTHLVIIIAIRIQIQIQIHKYTNTAAWLYETYLAIIIIVVIIHWLHLCSFSPLCAFSKIVMNIL